MKYNDFARSALTNASYGFTSLVAAPKVFKDRVLEEVERSNSSIATVKTFLEFLEMHLAARETPEDIDLRHQMFMSAVFIGNGCGLDPTKHSDFVCAQDLADLQVVERVQNEQLRQASGA